MRRVDSERCGGGKRRDGSDRRVGGEQVRTASRGGDALFCPEPHVTGTVTTVLSDRDRRRRDDRPDETFYAEPRFVTHADDAFLDRLTSLYASVTSSLPSRSS